MKKHFFYTLLCIACAYGHLSAQPFYKVYGGAGADEARSVVRLSDNNYALVGTYDNPVLDPMSGLPYGKDIILLKFDADGNEIWKKIIQMPDNQVGRAVYELPSGDIAIGGEDELSAGNRHTFVLSVTADGLNINWKQSFLFAGIAYQSNAGGGKLVMAGGNLLYACDYKVNGLARLHLFAFNPITGDTLYTRKIVGGNFKVGNAGSNTFQLDFFQKSADTLLAYCATGDLWTPSDNQACIYFIDPADGSVNRIVHKGLNPANFGFNKIPATRPVKTFALPKFAANSLYPNTVTNLYVAQGNSAVLNVEICITRRNLTNLDEESIGGGTAGDGKLKRFYYAPSSFYADQTNMFFNKDSAQGGTFLSAAFESAIYPGHTWAVGSSGRLLAADRIGPYLTNDGYIGRFDDNLNLVVSKIIGGTGDDRFSSAVAMPGGGAMIVGYTASVGSGGTDILIARIGENGEFNAGATCSNSGGVVDLMSKDLPLTSEDDAMDSLDINVLFNTPIPTTLSQPGFTTQDIVLPNASCLLPINFTGFAGKETIVGDELVWAISSNNDLVKGFTVEYSSNGIDFNTIATAVPSSNEQTNYNYTNTIHLKGPSAYYRIKCIDKNNSFKYSSTIKIAHLPLGKNIIKVFSSPQQNSIKVGITANEAQSCMVRIFDHAGRLLLQQIKQLQKGTNTFDCSNAAISNNKSLVVTIKTNNQPLNSVEIIK
jgi:hypothetical protein